jgi:glutamate racemase
MGQDSTIVTQRHPIGVFDSGVGGLTVVRELRKKLPHADIVYLGDTARVPYGSKSPRTVERYSLACQRFLLERGVQLVLIACNTASANALPALRAASPVPVIGAVEPGATSALAATTSGHIGVIGTLGTVRSGAYPAAIAARAPGAQLVALACPLLVPLAEEGWTDDELAALVARRYLAQLFAQDPEIDTLVLGCTHYPLLRDVLAREARELAGREIAVVDSATAMAEEAARTGRRSGLGPRVSGSDSDSDSGSDSDSDSGSGSDSDSGSVSDSGRGRLELFATDTSRLDELAPRFLGEPIDRFELVDL